MAVLLPEAIHIPAKGGKVNIAVSQNWGGYDIAGEGLPPHFVSGAQMKTTEVMAAICPTIWEDNDNSPLFRSGHAHEGIAEPFLPDCPSFD